MVFVADEIPAELRRVVEFLNQQMDLAEVLVVAIRQYVGDGLRTLVPQVVGKTAEAESRKGGGTRAKRRWDEASFFAALDELGEEEVLEGARRFYAWSQHHMTRITWGEGAMWGILDDARRREFLQRLNGVPGVSIPEDALDRFPSFSLTALATEHGWAAFEEVLRWYLEQIGAAPDAGVRS